MLLLKNILVKMIWSISKKEAFASSIAPGIESKKQDNLDTNIKGNPISS